MTILEYQIEKMDSYIKNLIAGGENQGLDFKFEINDYKKISRTLSAFSNTDGGILLIGVKDNGVISGIRSDEELHMIQGAAELYCKPPIKPTIKDWNINGKIVLEIKIGKSVSRPLYGKDEKNRWRAYVRISDQNFKANKILIRSWSRKQRKTGTYINFSKSEKIFMDYLSKYPKISFYALKKLIRSSSNEIEIMLVNFLALDLIYIQYINDKIYYSLKKPLARE